MQKIRVLQVGKYSLSTPGGIENVTRSICKLNRNGIHVETYTFGTGTSLVNERLFRPLMVFGKPFSLRMFFQILVNSNMYDVIHIHYPNLQLYPLLFFLNKRKVIVHYHCDFSQNRLLSYASKFLDDFVGLSKCRIIFTSEQYREFTLRHVRPSIFNSTVIKLGIPNMELNANREDSRGEVRKIISIGRLVEYKNFTELIEAFSHQNLENTTLTICGNGNLLDALRKQVNIFGLEHKVAIKSDLSDLEIQQELNSADIFVLNSTSRQEAFGVVLIEAMRSGLPIVTRRILGSGVSSVNKDGRTGFITNTVDELLSKAAMLLRDKRLYTEFSEAAKKRFDNQFTEQLMINRIIGEYISVYERSGL